VPKIHELLKFDGVIETDSGAYQILQYGDVEVQPNQIIRFQEQLNSDIGVILDVPTGEEGSKERAKWTVDETLRRADQSLKLLSRDDILWVGPVQGGMYLDLVSYSAEQMAKRDFSIYALGSPTPVMQQYRFETLVDMIMAAKAKLPPNKPLHLFGAGHPMMFAFAVALGCDIFDSASYALFARNGRYMTAQGTSKIEELAYFPCNCPACHRKTPDDVRKQLLLERDRFLAAHNLHACFAEIQTIKQAVADGRLWELVETRSRNHPALQTAFRRILTYSDRLEMETPVRKRKGPFMISEQSLFRPEVIHYEERLRKRYKPPNRVKKLLLLPESQLSPFRENASPQDPLQKLERQTDLHVCSYGLTYAIIPHELLDVYPLSQTETAITPTQSAVQHAVKRIVQYLKQFEYSRCLIVGIEPWQETIARSIKKKLSGKVRVSFIKTENFDGQTFRTLMKELK